MTEWKSEDLYMRHQGLLNTPKHRLTPITVIGAGAIGSYTTVALAKLGLENITVWDFDSVEAHNIGNQAFGVSQIGRKKVDALYNTIVEMAAVKIVPVDEKFQDGCPATGHLFMLVDSMEARKVILDSVMYNNLPVSDIYEGRMGFLGGQTLHYTPTDIPALYASQLWFPDSDVPDAPCTERSCPTTVMSLAAAVANMFVKVIRGESNEVPAMSSYHFIGGSVQQYADFNFQPFNNECSVDM